MPNCLSNLYNVYLIRNTIVSHCDQATSQEPDTVCHVLQNLNSYSDQVIRIRGEWRAMSLWGECPNQLQTDGYKWPNAIYLVCKEMLNKTDKPVDWAFGINDFNQLLLQTLRFKLPVYATFEGRLDARAKLLQNPKNGPRGPAGYGHLGYYPAQIVVRRVVDITGAGLLAHPREMKTGSIED